MLFDDERALAQPKALFGPLLNGRFEGCTGEAEMVSIDQDMTDFAVRPHSLDAVRIVRRRHRSHDIGIVRKGAIVERPCRWMQGRASCANGSDRA